MEGAQCASNDSEQQVVNRDTEMFAHCLEALQVQRFIIEATAVSIGRIQ